MSYISGVAQRVLQLQQLLLLKLWEKEREREVEVETYVNPGGYRECKG